MKIKNYSDTSFEELKQALTKHINGGNSLEVLFKILKENEIEYPELRNLFIHDMSSFMTRWFALVNETNGVTKTLQAKILSMQFMQQYSDFNNIVTYCYDVIDDRINEHTGNKLSLDIISYLTCVIKAIIQTTRREKGFDLNSKKYGRTKTNKRTNK